ncbi:MAG: hypothetical protein R3F56_19850 [Planctomycetota bacterium]
MSATLGLGWRLPILATVRAGILPRSALAALCVVSALAIGTLLAGVPTVHALRGWFWPLRGKPPQVAWLLLACATVGVLSVVAYRVRRRYALATCCLFAAGVAAQYGAALAEGRGLDALRERVVFTGHSEFARIAASGRPALDLLTDYENLAGRDNPYCAVKPPGQLLLYVALERLAQRLVPADLPDRYPLPGSATHRFGHLVELMTWLLPFLAALVVWPLGALGRRFLTGDTWLVPALLFVLSAPFSLVVLHLDQALFPTAATTLWVIAARAGDSRRSVAYGALGGLLAWGMAFVSFGLAPAIALAPVFTVATAPRDARWQRTLGLCAGLGACVALVWLLMSPLYDPTHRYQAALAAHERWKRWTWDVGHVAAAARMNLVEFAWWANPGVTVVWLAALGRSLATLWRYASGHPREAASTLGLDLVNPVVAAILVVLAAASSTFAETPRLWMFLLPLLLLGAVRALGTIRPMHLGLVVMLQWAWTLATKLTQDFH